MAKLRIFVSYSFQDSPISTAVQSALSRSGHEVHVNTGQTHTPDLHRDISINLNKCEVVVPIVTNNWLASHECRDELVRANERRKIIVPFRHQSVTNDGPPKLPWFLRETLWVQWTESEFERAIAEIQEKLNNMPCETWKNSCYKDLRIIGDAVQASKDTPAWKSELCHKVLSTATSQIDKIMSGKECSFPVANEYAYLRFAAPIFGHADSILAVCIASISSFWTSPDFSGPAGTYLKTQNDSARNNITRLFVFESADELLHFRQILQDHHNAYGRFVDRGGVFLCSVPTYRRLLVRWSMLGHEQSMRQDFGLLSFDDSEERMHATLDDRNFHYFIYDESDESCAHFALIQEFSNQLRALAPGARDARFGIMRWSPEWAHDDKLLSDAAALLFQGKREPMTHIVLIRPATDTSEVTAHLRNLVVRFHDNRSELKIRSITLKRRCELSVTDRRYAAPLMVLNDFEYFLAMTFDDDEALRHYYQHEFHSVERERLYILLNPETESLFKEMSDFPKNQVHERSARFSQIERSMKEGGFIQRIDVSDDDPLVYLLNRAE